MKQLNLLLITLLLSAFSCHNVFAQNASLNILTGNSGQVGEGLTVFVEVTVCNTDPTQSIPAYKLRPQISVPSTIVSIPATGHNLPGGWNIVSNSGSVIRLTNGTDEIPANTCRTIQIAVQGNSLGGPSTVSGNLLFSNGNAPGSASGPATTGDNTADNSSTSTVEVLSTTPVTLLDFKAANVNCTPVLNWTTETEINSNKFEIERTTVGSSNWTTVGTLNAQGNSSTKVKYNFTDNSAEGISGKITYRLKMIDLDGHYKYSDISYLSLQCKLASLTVYPNPVQKKQMTVNIKNSTGNTTIYLVSSLGQTMFTKKIKEGSNIVDVSNIPDGVYTLTSVFENGSTQKSKVVILNK